MCRQNWDVHGYSDSVCSIWKVRDAALRLAELGPVLTSLQKEPERDESMTAATKNLDKWLFYFDRFNNHEISAKLDQALCEATEERMVEVQEASDLSWIEVGPGAPWLSHDLITEPFAVQVHATCRGCTHAVPSYAQMELHDGVLPCTR